jgi:hypothetical protein
MRYKMIYEYRFSSFFSNPKLYDQLPASICWCAVDCNLSQLGDEAATMLFRRVAHTGYFWWKATATVT